MPKSYKNKRSDFIKMLSMIQKYTKPQIDIETALQIGTDN